MEPKVRVYEDPPHLGPDDPPADFSREEAAYEAVREEYVRKHLGKVVLVVGDEVIGAFPDADKAFWEGFQRCGYVKMMIKEIRDPDGPDWVSFVDVNHPAFKRID